MYEAIKAVEHYSRLNRALEEAIKLIDEPPKKAGEGAGDPALDHASSLLEIVRSMAWAAYSAAYYDVIKAKLAAG